MYELLIKSEPYVRFLNKNFEKDAGSHFHRYILTEYDDFGGWRTKRYKRDKIETDSKEKIRMLINIIGLKMKLFYTRPDGRTKVIVYET